MTHENNKAFSPLYLSRCQQLFSICGIRTLDPEFMSHVLNHSATAAVLDPACDFEMKTFIFAKMMFSRRLKHQEFYCR